jgi:transposase
MKKNFILGMDIAQHSAVTQLDRADGSNCWRGTLSTDRSGWQMLEQVLAANHASACETLVLIEATGVYHLAWTARLHCAGAEVFVLNPLLAARLHSTANALRGHKTDRVDAASLCEAGRLHAAELGRFRYREQPARQGLKQLDHARRTLRKQLTNLKKAFKSHLELVFPALLAAGIGADTVRAANILDKASTAATWRALGDNERRKLACDKLAALDQACEQTLADEPLAQACAPAVLALLQAKQTMAGQLLACERQIASQMPPERVALIQTIPGFGEHTAPVMATYLPDSFEGWGSRKKIVARLQALFGMDPRLRQSGKWTGKVKLSKRGIAAGRTALFQAAFCTLGDDPEMTAYYKKLREVDKFEHREAMVSLMRKQLRRLVAVLCNNRPFEPAAPPKGHTSTKPTQPVSLKTHQAA